MASEPPQLLPKEGVSDWIASLLEGVQVLGPVAGRGGDEVFSSISRPQDLLWTFENPLLPPKSFLLPQTEPLAQISRNGGGVEVEPLFDEEPRVLMNLRNCDASGIRFLRTVHAQDLADDTFLRRADAFTLVTLACTTPCPLGFCVCFGAGPFLTKGFDLQLTDLGDAFLADVGSRKGLRLLEGGRGEWRTAGEADIQRRKELEARALRSFGPVTCHLASAMRKVSTRRVPEALWEAMAPWCLECGGCNMACPTCYCFSVKDRKENGEYAPSWTRCRTWDSCQYPAFTMEASGHNPRAEKAARIKRRFHHKVSAQYYAKVGLPGCVGCGRCIKVCMGTTHMPAVVEAIRESEWKGGWS